MRALAQAGLFDAAWYVARYPDVAASGLSPDQHYLDFGSSEGRFPHPLFDPRWYRARYPDVAAASLEPLFHYARHGAKERRWPNAWFDPDYYFAQVGARDGIADPLAHFLRHAGPARPDPHPRFSVAAYRRQFPQVDRDGLNPLQHFLHEPNARTQGWLGTLTSTFVAGWACRLAGPPLTLTVRVNNEMVGEVAPWLERPDVAAIGLTETSGYFFSFPRRLATGDIVEILDEALVPLLGSPSTYRVEPLSPRQDIYKARASVAAMFLKGEGLEIGAFTQPTDLPTGAFAHYYDRFPADRMRAHYDENWGRPLVEPDYFGDAQTLEGLPEGAKFDFIVANHVIEHFEDPIAFLESLCRVLRAEGCAMIAAPDMRFTFDVGRPLTAFAHLAEDHRRGAAISRKAHYAEWASLVVGLSGQSAQAHAEALDRDNFSIHFHVWDASSFLSFLGAAIETFALPLGVVFGFATNGEIIVILKRL